MPSTATRVRTPMSDRESRMTTPKSWRPDGLQYVSQKRDPAWPRLVLEAGRPEPMDLEPDFARAGSVWVLAVLRNDALEAGLTGMRETSSDRQRPRNAPGQHRGVSIVSQDANQNTGPAFNLQFRPNLKMCVVSRTEKLWIVAAALG
jgi:hypothetical protein